MSGPDWLGSLSDEERRDWDQIVAHVQDKTVPAMQGSAFVMSLVPSDGKPDIKFAVELGLTIMMEKPLVVVAAPGQHVPDKLLAIADLVIRADTADPDSARDVAQKLREFIDARGE